MFGNRHRVHENSTVQGLNRQPVMDCAFTWGCFSSESQGNEGSTGHVEHVLRPRDAYIRSKSKLYSVFSHKRQKKYCVQKYPVLTFSSVTTRMLLATGRFSQLLLQGKRVEPVTFLSLGPRLDTCVGCLQLVLQSVWSKVPVTPRR